MPSPFVDGISGQRSTRSRRLRSAGNWYTPTTEIAVAPLAAALGYLFGGAEPLQLVCFECGPSAPLPGFDRPAKRLDLFETRVQRHPVAGTPTWAASPSSAKRPRVGRCGTYSAIGVANTRPATSVLRMTLRQGSGQWSLASCSSRSTSIGVGWYDPKGVCGGSYRSAGWKLETFAVHPDRIRISAFRTPACWHIRCRYAFGGFRAPSAWYRVWSRLIGVR